MASWRINQEFDLRVLGGELFAFHGGSGATHRIAGLGAAIVDELMTADIPLDGDAIRERIGCRAEADTGHDVASELERLQRIGLLQHEAGP